MAASSGSPMHLATFSGESPSARKFRAASYAFVAFAPISFNDCVLKLKTRSVYSVIKRKKVALANKFIVTEQVSKDSGLNWIFEAIFPVVPPGPTD